MAGLVGLSLAARDYFLALFQSHAQERPTTLYFKIRVAVSEYKMLYSSRYGKLQCHLVH